MLESIQGMCKYSIYVATVYIHLIADIFEEGNFFVDCHHPNFEEGIFTYSGFIVWRQCQAANFYGGGGGGFVDI